MAPRDAPGSETQEEALVEILRGFPRRQSSARLKRAPSAYGKRGARWVEYRVEVASDADQIYGYWQAFVATGILRSVSMSRRWPDVAGLTFILEFSNGQSRLDHEGLIGSGFRGNVKQSSDEDVIKALRRSASESQVELVDIQFARPLGRLAPEITVETADPAQFRRIAEARLRAIADPILHRADAPMSEGIYIQVRDSDRRWIASYAHAVRAGGTLFATA